MEVEIQEVICPNCGKLLRGIIDDHGGCRLRCRCCGTLLYSKRKTKDHYTLDVKRIRTI